MVDESKLSQLEAWMDKNRVFPDQKSLNADERKVATFAGALRRYHNRVGLPEQVVARLRSMRNMPANHWNAGWTAHCKELVAWFAAHQRTPDKSSPDPQERKLALVFSHGRQSHRNDSLPEELQKSLRAIPQCRTWGIDRSQESSRWGSQLEELEQWTLQQGRLPKQSAREPDEHSLAAFLAAVHRRYHAGSLNHEHIQLLLRVPGMKDRLDLGRKIAAGLRLLKNKARGDNAQVGGQKAKVKVKGGGGRVKGKGKCKTKGKVKGKSKSK